jgi:hypothetical protein
MHGLAFTDNGYALKFLKLLDISSCTLEHDATSLVLSLVMSHLKLQRPLKINEKKQVSDILFLFIARKAIISTLLTKKKQRQESRPKINIEFINIQ